MPAPPPPDLPNMPDVSQSLSGYLRRFSLWARHGLADAVPLHEASPGVLLLANDAPAGTAPKVFILQVTSAGALVTTPVKLGSGKP